MSSEDTDYPSCAIDTEEYNYQMNSIHSSHTNFNPSSIHSLPFPSLIEAEKTLKEDSSDAVVTSSESLQKKSIIPFPDVTRVIGCINQVLRLTRYVPPNTSLKGKVPLNDIIAVIPAYNEELTIGMVVLLSLQHVGRVIVVDDGSNDRTAHLAWLSGADVVQLEKNQGKANAVKAGFVRAREIGCSAIVMLDADGQHNPSEIPDLLDPILANEADLVIGSRHLKDCKNDIPSYRRIGQRTLDLATNMGSSYKSTDSQSGFRAFSSKAIELFQFPSDGYNIESDMIDHYSRIGLNISEVPITVRYEVPFKHKKNPISHGMDVLTHIIGVIGYRRPLLTFGFSGSTFVILGVIVGFFAFTQFYSTGKFVFISTMFSGISLVLGLLLMTTGLILNSLVKIVKMGV
jgi:glycosyltransferase involved in cell wall biosynthesis